MTDVFLERTFPSPLSTENVISMLLENGSCFDIYKVGWNGSFLSADGRQMFCWFTAPDAESARLALRQAGAEIERLWPGSVHDAPEPAQPNVAVTRSFADPVTIEEVQALEDAGAWCLETHRVKFARTFFSRDRRRMVCLYQAPDAESVRLAQREAKMPVEDVWAFAPLSPKDLEAAKQ